MRALLVGAGGMGKAWAKNLHEHPEVEIAAWVDVREGAAAAAAESLGIEVGRAGTDAAKALVDLRPDFTVDVTPPEVHHDITLLSLAQGVPVLGEKPMADTMERARAMVRAAEAAGKLFMVSQSRRYLGGLVAYRNAIAQLGELGILNADFYIGAHFGGFRDEMESPLVLDMAIHTFDAARYLSAADPVAVYAEEFNPPWSWYQGNACASAIFEMSSGARFTYRGSWCAEGCHTSWESSWRAAGSSGSALWDGTNPPVAERVRQTGGFHSGFEALQIEVPEPPAGIKGSLEDFLRALVTGTTPMGECHDNIKSLAMVFGVKESARRGERIRISEML